jgi:hypothetical protein
MAVTIDPAGKLSQFATRGFIARRKNPDGTIATAERTLGALLPVDLTATRNGMKLIDATKKGKLAVKVDGLGWEIKDVAFTVALNLAAVKPDEAVEALTNAGYSNGVTFTVDAATGMIKAAAPGHKSLQLWGFLAGALGFGGGSAFRCLGTAWRDYLTDDDTITIQRSDQRTEATNIDQTGSHNGLTRIIVQGKRTGVNYTLNVKPYDMVFRQMAEGGALTVLPATGGESVLYEPPLATDDTGEKSIELLKIDPMYQPNATSREGDERKIKTEHCKGATLTPADEGGGAMTISSFNYNVVAGDYTDENGVLYAQPLEQTYERNTWATLDIISMINPAPNFQMMGYFT